MKFLLVVARNILILNPKKAIKVIKQIIHKNKKIKKQKKFLITMTFKNYIKEKCSFSLLEKLFIYL